MGRYKLAAVVVTYNTDVSDLRKNLEEVSRVATIFIADNSDCPHSIDQVRYCARDIDATYIGMAGNSGLGLALNRAINAAFELDHSHVLLLDDDSFINVESIQFLVSQAIIGGLCITVPRVEDEDGVPIYPKRKVVSLPSGQDSIRDLMSSGALISKNVWSEVKEFDEKLFIDCVDFEFGWRAQRLGIPILEIKVAKIVHRLGEGSVLNFRLPSPIRHYYQYRNIIALIRRLDVPGSWKAEQLLKLSVKPLLILLLSDHRLERLRYVAKGILHGIMGNVGHIKMPMAK